MAEYEYEGVGKDGKKVTGKMEVPTEGDLRMGLRGQGVRPTRIRKVGVMNADLGALFGGGGSVPLEQIITLTRQLQLLISSGIPIVQGLEILSDQLEPSTLKNILIAIRQKVSQGAYFWESLAHYPKVFPKLFVSLVRAGEASGALDQMLKRLSRYLEDEDRLNRMVKSAMMYPVVVISIGSGVITLMLVFVIPRFEEMLTGAGQKLPMPTQVLVDASHFLIRNALYIIAILGTLGFLLGRYLKTPEGRAVKDRIVFRMPVFGPMAQKSGVARFCRTMQTLLMSGVNLLDAVDICSATIDNAVIEDSVKVMRPQIELGKTLGEIIAKLPVFPGMAAQMISVGESTGNMDKMLEKVADFYEAEVEIIVAGMSKLIEPIVIVVLGSMVGGIMVAMYLPIFKMASTFG